ncbi:MAG TPA: hypothetical protein VF796_30840 [Humisphaera sp.]
MSTSRKTSDAPTGHRRRAWRRLGAPAAFALAMVVVLLAPAVVRSAGKKPKKTDGPYTLTVAGDYTGVGRGLVVKRLVTLQGKVADESGTEGMLLATGLSMDGAHFRGTGLVMGRPADFVGRVDGYAGDKDFHGARVLVSFRDIEGRTGRVAGVLD